MRDTPRAWPLCGLQEEQTPGVSKGPRKSACPAYQTRLPLATATGRTQDAEVEHTACMTAAGWRETCCDLKSF